MSGEASDESRTCKLRGKAAPAKVRPIGSDLFAVAVAQVEVLAQLLDRWFHSEFALAAFLCGVIGARTAWHHPLKFVTAGVLPADCVTWR